MLLLGVVLIVGISAKKFVATEEEDAEKKVSVCTSDLIKWTIICRLKLFLQLYSGLVVIRFSRLLKDQ